MCLNTILIKKKIKLSTHMIGYDFKNIVHKRILQT